MEKVVAVIDLPEDCTKCRLTYLDTGDNYSPVEKCVFDGCDVLVGGVYDDCPLKRLKKFDKVNWTLVNNKDFYDAGYMDGWNACIDNLTEEDDD